MRDHNNTANSKLNEVFGRRDWDEMRDFGGIKVEWKS